MLDDGAAKLKNGSSVSKMTLSVEQPFFHWVDPESTRVFLRKYGGYCHKLRSRTSQLSVDSLHSLEPARPVGPIYCIDEEQLESAVECGMVNICDNFQSLTDNILQFFLEKEVTKSANVITLDEPLKMFHSFLKMDMNVKSARNRMKLLFRKYKSLLRIISLQWLTEKTPKVAIKQVLSII